jgi:hypothetical protein
MRLPNDTARCNGAEWDECETCLRRIAPRPEWFSMIAPPLIVAFECENLITDDYPPKKWEPRSPIK